MNWYKKAQIISDKDKKYLDANNKDWTTAQKMVDEEANIKLKEIMNQWKSEGVESYIYCSRGDITLSEIRIPKENRGQGLGTSKMKELLNFAQKQNMRVILTPSTDFGASSKSRLERFYKALGFVGNKGSNKDFRIRETMIYRPPNYNNGSVVQYDSNNNIIPLSVRFL
jgi:predicted GNAT family N-acyltransferase